MNNEPIEILDLNNNEETLEQQLHKKLVRVLKNRYDHIK